MERYPDIGEHGLIGDLQTAALVSTDGTIDWFCCPRFDSPSIFASLLDHDRGGFFRVAPDRDDYVSPQLYFPDTAILITRFMTPEGVGEVVDFMPVVEGEATNSHRLVRLVRVVRGSMRFRMEVQPRFDYGRKPHELQLSDDGALFVSDDLTLTLHRADVPGRSLREQGTSLKRDGDGLRITKTGREGEIAGVVMESAGGPPRSVHPQELVELFNDTVRFWRGWLNRSTYNGRWQEQVARSAMSLKLMTYAPTGGLVAAPTAALPEQVGGERNWDYRYTWVRDASFSVHALLRLGLTEEAAQLGAWLGDRIRERVGSDSGPLNLMYRIDGSSDLKEDALDHWRGYRGSTPVRIGNGAAEQLQLDIYGEALDSVFAGVRAGLPLPHRGWTAISRVLDWLVDNWDQPDEGIWETRGGRQPLPHRRGMWWGGFERGIPP